MPKLEVLGVQHAIAKRRVLAALESLRPDDVGHAGRLNPDVGGDAGIEVGRAGEESRLAGAVVATALASHGKLVMPMVMVGLCGASGWRVTVHACAAGRDETLRS